MRDAAGAHYAVIASIRMPFHTDAATTANALYQHAADVMF